MTNSQRARTKLFQSPEFREKAAARLGLPEMQVAGCISASLDAGRIPHSIDDDQAALAKDGSYMLSAIGSRQTRPSS